jgi:hypothetical protein
MLDSAEGKGSVLRQISLITAVLAATCQMAAAAVTGNETPFTTVCIDDSVIGYEWRDGGWMPGTFHTNKYTLQKRDAASEECADAMKAAPAIDDLFSDISVGCYTMTDFGKGPRPPMACDEKWEMAADGSESLATVTCTSAATSEWILFDPMGYFDYASTAGNLAGPGDDTKEPIILSVGACNSG